MAKLVARPWFVALRDWLVVVVMVAVSLTLGTFFPFARPFKLDDPSINFPFISQRIARPTICPLNIENFSPLTLFVVSLVIPAIILFTVSFFKCKTRPKKERIWELHCACLRVTLCVSMANTLSAILKLYVGRPTPGYDPAILHY